VRNSIVGIRAAVRRGSKVANSILLGADYFDESASELPLGIGLGIGKDSVLDKVIVDKNARIGDGVRLTNERGIENADGDGYHIRSGIIIVPKGGVVKPGTVV
jgi:glucose-1-phosphate adenylyltransferase